VIDNTDALVKYKQASADEDDDRCTDLDPGAVEGEHDENDNNEEGIYDVE
jgi:hypothetical protein